MKYNNNFYQIIFPIIISLVFIGGIYFTHLLPEKKTKSNISTEERKLQAILNYIVEEYVDSIDLTHLIENTLPPLLDYLDPHSIYIPASDLSEASEPLEGEFEGIGIEFNMQSDTIVVINTISGGPSEKIGILPGDRIVLINDSLFAGRKIDTKDIIKQLKGKRGTKVKVSIKRKPFEELIDYEITRDRIPLHSVDVAFMYNDDIGYIKISKFAKHTHKEFVHAAKQMLDRGMKKIILDLRGNSGGYLDAATALSDEFLEANKLIVYTQGRNRPKVETFSSRKGSCKNIELAVLIDEWSASASEIFAGAMQDNDRGIVIGRRSFGKALVQEPTFFKDGSSLRLTVARYYTPLGRSIQRPYEKGTVDYYESLVNQILDPENQLNDTIQKEKFVTPKGKILYGGGGILPDIVIGHDTTDLTPFFREVVRKNLIYRFAWDFSDNNRKSLEGFKDWKSLDQHLDNINILNRFNNFLKKQEIIAPENDKANKIILTHIKAYIARNIIDSQGFYPIALSIDNTFLRAVEELSK